MSLSNNVYILCTQPSYAKISALVMERFAFPSVPGADSLQCNHLYGALTTQGPDQHLTERLNRKVFVVTRHISNHTETGKVWEDNLERVVVILNQLGRVLATTYVTNYRMRRMLIDPFVLYACCLTGSLMTMDSKPGVPTTLHAHRAGFGVLHNILNDRLVIWNQPMPEDVMFEATTDSDAVYDNVENEEEECSDEYKVYVQKCMKRSEAECAHQGLGGAHDLLFVEGRAHRDAPGSGVGSAGDSGDMSSNRKRSISATTDQVHKHARTDSTEQAEYTLKPSADFVNESPPSPPPPPLSPVLPQVPPAAPYIKPVSALVVSTGHHYRAHRS